MITGLTNSAVALAVQNLTADKRKISIVQNAAADALVEANCSANGIVWNWTARPIVKSTVSRAIREGRKSWYFIVSDYAGGKAMEDQAADVIRAAGGSILGSVHPAVGTSDFASYLISARASGAQTLGVMTFGQDFVNLLKQAVEFGVTPQMQPIAPFVFQSDLHAAGLTAIQGMTVAAPFYWNLNPQTRAFSARFRKATGREPDVGHAGTYNAIMHYLNAVKSAKQTESAAILSAMRATPVNDMSTKDGKIREDGTVERQLYLFEGKKPSDSHDSWDLLRQIGEVPKEEAFPLPTPPKCILMKS
jgi:branched-chain amino acid transport system substrate-binding protein